MPRHYAEVDLIFVEGVQIPDLPQSVTSFAVIDYPEPGRVLVETDSKVATWRSRRSVMTVPDAASKLGMGRPDDDPDFMARGMSKEEKAQEKALGRALKEGERDHVKEKRAKEEKIEKEREEKIEKEREEKERDKEEKERDKEERIPKEDLPDLPVEPEIPKPEKEDKGKNK